MFETLLRKAASTCHRLFGSTKLLPHEQMCLDAWRAAMTDESRRILDAQLAAVHLVQRQAGGAKVCFYYRESKATLLFQNDRPDVHAATVVLRSEGTERPVLQVKMFLHRGRFFSIEFPKRPDRYMQQHGMTLEKLTVADVEMHVSLEVA